MHDSDWESFVQRVLCPVMVTSIQSSEPTWKSFPSLDRTRCSISVPFVSKRSSEKKNVIPATDFPVAGLLAVIQHFLRCSIYFCPHTRFGWDVACIGPLCIVPLVQGSLTRLYWVQHVTASISPRGNHATATQGLLKDIPPASGGIIHAVCRFLQSCSTHHHDSHHKIVLEERPFWDENEKDSILR